MENESRSKIRFEKHHPEETANILSRLFFCWTLPIFWKGYKRSLNEDDLYKPLKVHESQKLGDKLEKLWNNEKEKNKTNPLLWRVLLRMFQFEFVISGIAVFIMEFIFDLMQPYLLQKLLEYYVPDQQEISKTEAYIYSIALISILFTSTLVDHHYIMCLLHLGMKIRVACTSLLYRKLLKLSRSTIGETTIGQLINLMSNDIGQIESSMLSFHNLWIAPIKTVVTIYLMVMLCGPFSLTGISVLLIFLPIQLYIAKAIGDYCLKISLKSDKRIHLMDEIIKGIQTIKMYNWEEPFANLISKIRKEEVKLIKFSTLLRGIDYSFVFYMDQTIMFICMIAYVLAGYPLQAEYVYVVSLFYQNLSQVVVHLIPESFQSMAEARVAFQRVKNYLDLNEIDFSLENNLKIKKGVFLKNINVSSPNFALKNINFEAFNNNLIAIIGKVGSGKSSLLQIIMNELHISDGQRCVEGTISYASQEAWIFSSTIRQNILFGEPMDAVKYQTVIKVCALQRDFSLFVNGDNTIVGERGVMLSGGQKARISLARAVYKDADIYLLDDPLSAVDTHVGKHIFQQCICDYLKNKCVILVTHQHQYLNQADKIYVMEQGKITISGNFKDLQNSTTYLTEFFQEDIKAVENCPILNEQDLILKNGSVESELDAKFKESKNEGKVDKAVYMNYIQSGGGLTALLLMLIFFILCQTGSAGADYFLMFWVNLEQEPNRTINNNETFSSIIFSEYNFIYIYLGILIFTGLTATIAMLIFVQFITSASRNLHNNMFSKVIYATIRFFNINSSGRILNRFSKDIDTIDDELPDIILDTIVIALTTISVCVLNSLINPWILIPTLVLFAIFSFYRYVFLKTSRDLKRMEGTTKSPVLAHVTASAQGLTTIRVFKAQQILISEFDRHQDLNSASSYLLFNCDRTLGFNLDVSCILFFAVIVCSFLFMDTRVLGATVGLAITQSLMLTGMIQWGIRQWSAMETQMIAVERITEYTKLITESNSNKQKVPKFWPERGEIEFCNISMQYSPSDPFVLHNLNFKIQSKEKIGIVGRTGAGKSSLISVLFRLVNFDGSILIDNVDTKDVPLAKLRSQIAIIPQEPVLFSGALRRNLDPFDEFDDADIWRALEDVELKKYVHSMPLGLQSAVSEDGANFSVGQRQLFCLARAILRSNRILVLDEATANVDPQTDELIQATVRRKFGECTVLTIAHRLHTVMDSDKILVMEAGRVAQYGPPSLLLKDSDGIFSNLVKMAQISIPNKEDNS